MTKLKGKARAKASKKKRLKDRYESVLYKKRMLDKIRKFDDPILKQKCEPVENNEDVSQIVKDLRKILIISKDGVGLAAPQIGYTKNIIAIKPELKDNVKVFINPEITEHGESKVMMLEGCLSFPGVFAPVERYEVITVDYFNENNEKIIEKFIKKKARIISHEIDHLFGICQVGDKWAVT